jgi:hypothetical protein
MGESKCCGNGWTELTPDRVKELNLIEPHRIVIARLKDDGSVISTTRAGHNYYSLEEVVAETDLRFYYFILPELKKSKTKIKSEKLKLTFNQTAPAGGDCTAPYGVSLNMSCNLKELVESILKEHDRGCITVRLFNSLIPLQRVEYRQGKVVGDMFPEYLLNSEVRSVVASGGWGMMDYIVRVK